LLMSSALLLFGSAPQAQNSHAGLAISLSVKTFVYPSDSFDQSGHGKVEAFLRYKDGAPIPNQRIEFSSTSGNFSCKLPDIENEVDSSSSDESCFTTGKDGKILVYIINIPFNSQGMVTASCTYDDVSVKATGTYWIKRMLLSKMAGKKKKHLD
jgi:hypothetical protein